MKPGRGGMTPKLSSSVGPSSSLLHCQSQSGCILLEGQTRGRREPHSEMEEQPSPVDIDSLQNPSGLNCSSTLPLGHSWPYTSHLEPQGKLKKLLERGGTAPMLSSGLQAAVKRMKGKTMRKLILFTPPPFSPFLCCGSYPETAS